jgi:hypothetical protein
MTTIGILVFVAVVIGLFSYYTNAGFGDRRPKQKLPPEGARRGPIDHASGDEPPPSK